MYFLFIFPNQHSSEDNLFYYSLLGGLILWVVGYWWYAAVYKITLDQHSIQVKSLFGTKRITTATIGTYKVDETGLHIFLKHSSRAPELLITTTLDHPQFLYLWLQKYSSNPELEAAAKEYEEELKEILNNDSYGTNTVEKEENLAATRKIAQWLNGIVLLTLPWTLLGSLGILPYVEVSYLIVFFIPILLIYFSVKYKGFFSLDMNEDKRSNFPNIHSILCMSSVGLGGFWVFSNLHMLDSFQVWPYAAVISALITIPLFLTVRTLDFKKISSYFNVLFVWLLLLGYGYGATAFVNFHFDNSKTKVFSVQVLKKELGKNEDSAHHLTLAPWHTYQEATTIEMPLRLVKRVEEGKEVTVHLKDGFLGIPYYAVYVP